jgi:formate hydrogenlyase subunit 3/multisubunit Na+/H+ antiporter MnhD subunit
VIGLIRFLPFEAALPGWGDALVVFGFVSAFYGVAIGITQPNPKAVLAYSSISQMGVIAVVLGMGLAAADKGAALDAAFYAAHHVLVKGALFLAIGVVAATSSRRRWLVLLPAAVLALSLGGLPLTGGALAKLAVKAPLGNGLVGMLAAISAAGTTLLMVLSPAPCARLVTRRSGGGCRRTRRALADDGAGFFAGPLADVSRPGRRCRRGACPCSAPRSALAGSERHRAGYRIVVLGEPAPAHTRR